MKFWLACFFLLFVAAELFEWISQIGNAQLQGAWLVLGGMGLAAASNAAHLPKLSGAREGEAIAKNQTATPPAEEQQDFEPRAQEPSTKGQPEEDPEEEEPPREGSIFSKVRLPWR